MLNLPLIALAGQFILQIASFATATQQQCYYPKGNPSGGDIPCGDGVNHSHCCGFDYICLSNKLCLHTAGSFELSRGSCTDSTWQSPNCPSHCTNVSIDSGIPLGLYSFGHSMPSRYCCGTAVLKTGSSSLGCAWSPQPFTLEPGDIIADRGVLKDYILAGSRKSNSTCPANCTCPMETNSNIVLAVGVGLGIPLGILSIAILSWALWERNHRRSQAANARFIPLAIQPRQKSQPLESETPTFQPQAPGQITELRHEREPAELN
ncbi:hypothetical protein F4782DRAFT_542969 [Xylaria castorea]|nr:hypothetical protein F4782DRAFT_542969 [Xylaria castorea]